VKDEGRWVGITQRQGLKLWKTYFEISCDERVVLNVRQPLLCLQIRSTFLLKDLEQHVDLACALESMLQVDKLIENDADTPGVDSKGVALVSKEDLRSSVPHALNLLGHGKHWVPCHSTKSKVSELYMSIFEHQDIGRFDVSMHYSSLMHEIYC
jgi:hypothetical protein